MAKAQFHRLQKVWVDPVGTWATIDRVVPVWAKGFDEPVRITYDCGLGREFLASELKAEDDLHEDRELGDMSWRLMRARNKWQAPEDCPHHPVPGTYPVVVTDPNDWGGWRVPGAEYDRDPTLIEMQARLIASAPKLLRLAKALAELSHEETDLPPALDPVIRRARSLVKALETPPPPGTQAVQPGVPAQTASA